MSLDLAGRTIIVSGAAGGVGRSVVGKLAAMGACVCATDLTPSVLELGAGKVVSIVGDVTKSDHVNAIYEFAESKLGPVDGLVSNAGFIISKSVHETSEEEWDSVMNANAKSFFLMAKRALPSMTERRTGTIVATGSISSVVGLPSQAPLLAQ